MPLLYTDRGIYRPGETVELIALVRDHKADAMPSLPVGLRLLRPDGVEVEKRQPTGDRLGAYRERFALPRDARFGAWRVELRLDPKAPPIGTAEFRAEDFVPPQLKLALAAADAPIRPGDAFPVDVNARYYYGAPGAGLAIEAEAVISLDEEPFPTHPGFQFGLVGEEFTGDRRDLEAPSTHHDGKVQLSVVLDDLPDLTRPLAATIRVGVFEPSGRAVYETVSRPIRQRPVAIGLRSPAGDDAVPGKEPTRLSAPECALLVGIPRSPERLRPDRHPAAARAGRDQVLLRMAKAGVISPLALAEARAEAVPRVRIAMPFRAPHLARALRNEDPAAASYRTTIDPFVQRQVKHLLKREVLLLDREASIAAIVVGNGDRRALAYAGSADFNPVARRGTLDMARAVRSPGSALKPFIYAMAFDRLDHSPGNCARRSSPTFRRLCAL